MHVNFPPLTQDLAVASAEFKVIENLVKRPDDATKDAVAAWTWESSARNALGALYLGIICVSDFLVPENL